MLTTLAYRSTPIKEAVGWWSGYLSKGKWSIAKFNSRYPDGSVVIREEKDRDMVVAGMLEGYARFQEKKKAAARPSGKVQPVGPEKKREKDGEPKRKSRLW
jgi:membrane-anchored protein YejM (alkaline phosphatase superfamily)